MPKVTKGERAREQERKRVLKRKIKSLSAMLVKARALERYADKKSNALLREQSKLDTRREKAGKLQDRAYRRRLAITEELRELKHKLKLH
jgi:hypothetical protein